MKIIVSRETLTELTPKLLEESFPFEIKPLPDDFYQIASGNEAALKRALGEEKHWTVVTYDSYQRIHDCFNIQAVNLKDAEQHAVLRHLDEHIEEDRWGEYLEQCYVWTVCAFEGHHRPLV